MCSTDQIEQTAWWFSAWLPPIKSTLIKQNISLSLVPETPTVIAELLIGDATLQLFNGTDEQLI